MAHFAEIDQTNKVVRVLVIPDAFENNGQDYLSNYLGLGGVWVQTSYNASFRGKYAGVGDLYDPIEDVFIQTIIPSTDENKNDELEIE